MISDLHSQTGGEHPKGWPQKAQDYLNRLYRDEGADTIEKKIALLERLDGGQSNFYATTADGKDVPVPLEAKLGAYEYRLLEMEGLIEVKYC